jgi:hypothetical protein
MGVVEHLLEIACGLVRMYPEQQRDFLHNSENLIDTKDHEDYARGHEGKAGIGGKSLALVCRPRLIVDAECARCTDESTPPELSLTF